MKPMWTATTAAGRGDDGDGQEKGTTPKQRVKPVPVGFGEAMGTTAVETRGSA